MARQPSRSERPRPSQQDPASALLEASEARYRTLFDHAQVGILLADADGVYLDANASMCRMLGYSHDELVGLQGANIVVQSELAQIEPALRLIDTRAEYRREWQFRRKDGTVFPVDVVATKMPDGAVLALVRDLSDRKLADDYRRVVRDEKLFSDRMIDSLPGILYFYDSTGRFLRWNRNFETLSGYSADELAQMHPRDFFSGRDRERVEARIAEVFEKGESSVEARLQSKDGTSTPYLMTGRRVDLHDEPCLVGIGVDISAREEALAALREAELRFHTLFEQTPVGVVVIDPESEAILQCNPQAARQLGYTTSEYCALHLSQINAVMSRQDVRRRLDELLASGQDEFETQHRTKSGELRDVFVSGRLIQLSGRQVIYSVVLDITERKHAEAKVRDSEAHLVEAQRIAKIGSWTFDVKRNRITWSEQIYEMFELPRATPTSSFEGFLEFVHPLDRDHVRAALDAALSGTARLDIEHRILLPDGTEKVVHELADRRTDAVGNITHLSGTVHDVTDRRRIEAEREKRYRAEAADRIKSAFLATMSHELRTPLNSIIGFTGIVLQGLAGPLSEEQVKQLGMVQGSARHLLELINDVLDISKIEAGQLEVRSEPFDLRKSLGKVVGLIQPLAERKRLAFTTEISAELGEVTSDRRRVEQILLNLLNNAVKFTEDGGVTLAVDAIPDFVVAAGAAARRVLRIRVTDTGIGIREQDIGRLFQPFRQLDTGLTRQHGGTGLGLAICRRLAELLGGTISVTSKLQRGSEFTVLLPAFERVSP